MMKKCPYCAEENQEEAIICRHCLRDLWPARRGTPSVPQHRISSLEYVLGWLKVNNPELYQTILANLMNRRVNRSP